MSLISLAGKVRLRLRSASLTAICHSTSFPFPPHLPPPSLLWERLGFNLAAVGDGQDERLTQGAVQFRGHSPLPLPVLAREEVVSPASLMKAVDALYSSARQPKSLLAATSLEV
ncbi:unnamed protein product [Pleuronectes platessa]|uniref:Uncharacterized protein n=1 Tax=Pleuronectes platessa TaxID=8262 RepID=A0A9N7UBI9_PLEPL|nr:unnamed protein product [Pleuronectes platessa]